jgi:hypothetical protein
LWSPLLSAEGCIIGSYILPAVIKGLVAMAFEHNRILNLLKKKEDFMAVLTRQTIILASSHLSSGIDRRIICRSVSPAQPSLLIK